jgi:hypothetical protein
VGVRDLGERDACVQRPSDTSRARVTRRHGGASYPIFPSGADRRCIQRAFWPPSLSA